MLSQDPHYYERQLREAVRREPQKPEHWARLALTLSGQGQHQRAAAVVTEALQVCGETPEFLRALADLYADNVGHPDRIAALSRLIERDPLNPSLRLELAHSALQTPNPAGAISPLRFATENGIRDTETLLTLASAERLFGSMERAAQAYDEVLSQDSTNPTALVERWHLALSMLDWPRALELEGAVAAALESGPTDKVAPWLTLALPTEDSGLLRRIVTRHAGSHLSGKGLSHPRRGAVERIRIGYLSADFMQHATATLVAGLFSRHDRAQFEVFAFSYGPRSSDELAERISKSVEHWHDVSRQDDRAINRLLLSCKLDVLIEMKGHTSGARPEIARQRVAPIQLHYLGFPGPVGGFGIDYFVADSVSVPPGSEEEFNTEVIRLPGCYQVNDADRAPAVPVSKASLGTPENAPVIANFNQLWKIRPEYMRVWLSALTKHPTAELWLLSPGDTEAIARTNLEQWAASEGFAQVVARVKFQPRLSNAEHLNRLAAADLVIDQLPCSSHTTAADAIWAGVPLLTVRGNTFAGRVGASVAAAGGCSELICDTRAEYAERLESLFSQPAKLAAYKAALARDRATLSLFDTQNWVRNWEHTLVDLCAKHGIAIEPATTTS